MSATQSSALLKPQSSLPSNIHHGDINDHNKGNIGHGSGHNIASGDGAQVHSTQNFFRVPKVGADDGNELYNLLYSSISEDALHDSWCAPTKCHPGTREITCNSIGEWMSDPVGSPLLWLHGLAGVGKSVIAKTISSDQNRVVATFFFSTSSDKSAATLFPTLAWQLARNVPETKEHIVAALKHNPLLTKSELEKQFTHLIVEPLKKCASTMASTPVMVIDGVDECVDENMQIEFLKILKRAGWPLRFLICSRPEPRIRAILETIDDDYPTANPQATNSNILQSFPFERPDNTSQSVNPTAEQQSLSMLDKVRITIEPYLSINSLRRWRPRHPTVLPSDAWMLCQPIQLGVDKNYSPTELHDEPGKLFRRRDVSCIQIGFSEDDVKIYLTDKFMEISPSDPNKSKEIDELVKMSCGHFLYAFIIVQLLERSHFPLDAVLDMAQSSALPSPDLDKLYSAILDKAKKVMHDEPCIDAETDLVTLRAVFAILVVLWENVQLADIPESFPIIESLLVLKKRELERILRKMHSIFDIIPGKSIRVYHRSFFEFLQHRDRSKDHCIAYPFALQRSLFLLSRVMLRYAFRRYCSHLQDDDKNQAERIRNMVLEFPQNFFRRSANPTQLATFHVRVHIFVIFLLYATSFWIRLDFLDYLIVSLVQFLCVFIVRYFLVMLLFIVVGSFIPLLMCYMSYSIIRYPLFHPFLHPLLVITSNLLLSR